jgi:diguanylate cyclase (GGDEF)-like protein/PAS domain S-box-containing protein
MTEDRPVTLQDPEVLSEFIRNIQEGIYITNARGEILDANPAFIEMFGVSSLEDLRLYNVSDLLADPTRRLHEIEPPDWQGRIRELEFQIVRPDGKVRTVLDTTYVTRHPRTNEMMFQGILVDITARKELEDRLRELSLRDPLTGCYNRRYLGELEAKLSAKSDKSWGCLFIDVDHFKRFNDTHGHEAGDQVLVRMSRFLMRQVRAEESVIRVGGDEFVVILLGVDAGSIETIAQRMKKVARRTAPVSFSFGWALRADGESLEDTLRRADQHLLAVRVVERRRRNTRTK